MKTSICDLLGIDLPLLAFSHCRDVVAAVTCAGGCGVLGVTSSTPDELEIDLSWIDEQVANRPYGVDLVVPERLDPAVRAAMADLGSLVPQGHRDFVSGLLAEHGIT